VVTTTGFSALARFTGKAGGVPDLRVAEYPGPLGIHDPTQIESNIGQALIDQIIDGLTGAQSEHAGDGGEAAPEAIVFSGTAEEVSRHFIEKQWSDGLPVVAPTIERVEAFLDYTDEAPHEPVAVLPSANLQATPWNIAVNAVMAGCLPQHMPLLIAAV
jgi:hypothetical protein